MPRINLLPWREEQRRERKLRFLISLGGATLGALGFTFIAYMTFSSMISGQQARNQLLREEIKKLDQKIEEINDLENKKQQFIARMEIIEKLQRSRPEIVHVFDEIVRAIPDGTYLTGLKQTGKRLKFEGVAQSSTRVSTFMRNIAASEWLENPDLEVVETKQGRGAPQGASFTLFANQVTAAEEESKQSAGAKNVVARRGAAK